MTNEQGKKVVGHLEGIHKSLWRIANLFQKWSAVAEKRMKEEEAEQKRFEERI